MLESTITDKGQTTVPRRIREVLKLGPRKRIQWELKEDGTVTVKPKPSALELFGSLRSDIPFPGIHAEKEIIRKGTGEQVASEGL